MARKYGQIRVDMWSDDHWRTLSPAAQHLYMLLLTSPTLSQCGVADWRPARLAALADPWSVEDVEAAADELIQELFILVDESTEEVLIRSFIKHDGLMQQPKLAASAAIAHAATASREIRGVIVFELNKLHDRQPELNGWKSDKATEVLAKGSVNPSDYPLGKGLPKGSVKGSVYPKATPKGKGSVKGSVYGSPTPAPISCTSHLADSPPEVADATPHEETATREDVEHLCTLLADLIEGNDLKRPNITSKWRDAARLMLDRDNRDPKQAEKLIRWTQADEFWRGNILSMPKFRDKYDQLLIKARTQTQAPAEPEVPHYWRRSSGGAA